jgi:tetratricopeptide (TPR) repeat protein
MDSPDAPFLDVPALIESSQPQPRGGWFWYAVGIFLLIVMVSAYITTHWSNLSGVVDLASKLLMVGLMVGLALMTSLVVRRQRDELRRIESLEELVQLRRWPEAAQTASAILSQPTRTPAARIQALIYLSSVLARYHRFDDAIAVHDHLLNNVLFDDATAHGIKLGRAMAMLRQDHLVDADRAISELRRGPASRESAGLALIELYREVKTGHPAEAIERFEKSLPLFRQQLGHRAGDAYALLAKAYDMLDRRDEAQSAYDNATRLCAVSELDRRYPEVATLAGRYTAAREPDSGATPGAAEAA